MNPVMVVAEKEIRQLAKSRNVLISAVMFIIIFGAMTGPAVLAGESTPGQTMDQLSFYLILTLGIFAGYLFTAQVFLREKQDGVVETLLCTPLSLRQIWLGKVLGIVIPASLLSYLAAVMVISVGSLAIGITVLPSPPVLFHIIFVIPAFIAAASGLMGFAQLLLGMRENQILNFAIIFGLIFLISFTRELIGPSFRVTWEVVGAALALAVIILFITSRFTRFLSRERIVTTLPD